ncbi:BPSS1780 family membrane protein [Marinicella rhabdoformis]|uniref:BPSS1780 family membrane protein n=1 Tax=Marinicella rhabdoformis TaxID=2580566 RepID=UPI0012AEBD97|nr:BPSS1780 family membrane protein [Marinicella rhabdoformis]
MPQQITPQKSYTWADGQKWFYQGLELLPVLGALWLMVIAMYGLIAFSIVSINESLFMLLVAVFSPLITAGIYNACHKARQQSEGGPKVVLSDYFAAFKHQTTPLLMLGVCLLLMGFVTEVVTQTIFNALGLVIDEGMEPTLQMKNILIGQFISMVVSIPLLVVAFFSPQLVFFHKQTIKQAIIGSYLGFSQAWRGMLVLSLLIVALVFVTMFLGVLLSSVLGSLAVVLMSGAMIIIFSVNLTGQFFAFDALFPIVETPDKGGHGDDNESDVEGQIHTEI